MERNKILHNRAEIGLLDLPDNCIDAVITDPPYGLKFMRKAWDYEIPPVSTFAEILRVMKPGAHILCACGTRTQHRMAVNMEDAGFEIRDVICWHYGSGFPKSMNISKALDKTAGIEFNRESASGVGFMNSSGSKGYNVTKNKLIRKGESTDIAKQWDGWGTALKPATEFWTLARKPLSESTVAANILRWEVGGLNIDASRVPFESENDKKSAIYGIGTNIKGGNYGGKKFIQDRSLKVEINEKGRFPANIILDEFMASQLDEQTGLLTTGAQKPVKRKNRTGYTGSMSEDTNYIHEANSGGASRFFYVAKPSAEERGNYNTHPTVKPLALMHYLIKMICPIEPGRVILDPYAGSGTTLIAARQLGLDFIAYEMEADHISIIERRLQDFLGLFI